MDEGIHWLDGLIFIAICFSVYMFWKFMEARHAIKEIEKMMEDDEEDW